jgi:hypothetical protein
VPLSFFRSVARGVISLLGMKSQFVQKRSPFVGLAILLTVGVLFSALSGVAVAESDCDIFLSTYREAGYSYEALQSEPGLSGNYVYLATPLEKNKQPHVLKVYPTPSKAAQDYKALEILASLDLSSINAHIVKAIELKGALLKLEHVRGKPLPPIEHMSPTQKAKYKNLLKEIKIQLDSLYPEAPTVVNDDHLSTFIYLKDASYSIAIFADNVIEEEKTGRLVIIDPF